jgi:hypothetical protein
VVDPTSVHGCYKFIAAKRGKRIGWGGSFSQHFSHSQEEGVLLWVPSSEDEIKASEEKAKKKPDDIMKFIPSKNAEPVSMKNIIEAARGTIGETNVRDFVKAKVEAGDVVAEDFKREEDGKRFKVYRQK